MSVLRSESAKFLFFQFQSDILKRQINEVMGATINQITNRDMASFKVIWPPTIAEQEAIAEALSDADALIESLDQLIAKKRQIKQGAMQELLTGKRRLAGFSGEWVFRSLGEICSMKSGFSITGEAIDEHSPFPCYGGNGLRGFTATYTHDGRYGLIGRQGALCGNVVCVKGQFFASEHAIVVTPKSTTDIDWLTFVLRRMNLNQYSESSAQPGLSVSKLKVLECDVPPYEEQTAIAIILSDMDTELTALESRLAKARQIKQGMMQELLTGRIRLLSKQ
jgi:type I restriction enzyme S subunit